MRIASQVAESTIAVLIIAWIIGNSGAFSTVIQSVSTAITGSVNAFWKSK